MHVIEHVRVTKVTVHSAWCSRRKNKDKVSILQNKRIKRWITVLHKVKTIFSGKESLEINSAGGLHLSAVSTPDKHILLIQVMYDPFTFSVCSNKILLYDSKLTIILRFLSYVTVEKWVSFFLTKTVFQQNKLCLNETKQKEICELQKRLLIKYNVSAFY